MRGRPPKAAAAKAPENPPLNFYGLQRLGFDELPLTGDWITDQRMIETLCFRIGHRKEEGGLGKYGHFKNFVELRWNHPSQGSMKKFIFHRWSESVLQKFCQEEEVAIAGCTSSGKSGPAALWVVANYLMDPTHFKSFVLSTTLKGACDRVWKDIVGYWEAVGSPEGKLLKSTYSIQGLNFTATGFGTDSGIYLHAADQSSEASAIDKLIGAKVAKSGEPGASFEELIASPKFHYLRDLGFDDDYLRDLVDRLQAVEEDRMGKIVVVIDEATGVSEGVLNSIQANLKPGNPGRLQIIVLGNPCSRFDTHGIFCEPDAGWDSVTLNDEEWRTRTGGVCVRFDNLKNPRIIDGNEKLVWMSTKKEIADLAKKYGETSLYFFRMVRAFWAPNGADTGVYTEADFIQTGAMEPAIWGFDPPALMAGFDPAYTTAGDRALCWFALLGRDVEGNMVLEMKETVTIKPNALDKGTPVPLQIARLWRDECLKRGVPPERACFDSSGGGISFAALVSTAWSPSVHAISSGGKASMNRLTGEKSADGKPIRAVDRFANKATEIWMGAMPFLRAGQIKGVTRELAKEVCLRQYDKTGLGDARVLKIESKKEFKAREKQSPDLADAFFLLVEHAREKHGFRPVFIGDEGRMIVASTAVPGAPAAKGTWQKLKERSMRLHRSHKGNLRR